MPAEPQEGVVAKGSSVLVVHPSLPSKEKIGE